jgi:dipeptidyl-peptidase-4
MPDVMAYRIRMVVLVSAVALATASIAAQSPSLDDALQRIFERNELAAESLGPTAWLDDGQRYTAVRRGTGDLVAHDTGTGAEQVLVPATALVPAGAKAALGIDEYAWASDKSKLLLFTNTRKVWRANTRGDYWVLAMDAGKPGVLKKLGGDGPEASLMYAKFSPDGSRVAYVRAQNIYVEELASGRIVPLTTDGGRDISNGVADWVNEEEFSIYDAFRWSPDGRSIAFWQFDTSGVDRFTLIDNTSALYPRLLQFPYPKPGTTNSAVRVGIVPAGGGPTVWVKSAEPLRDHYIPRMEWADERTLVVQNMNRLQNRNDVLLADAATGETRRVMRDEGKAWVEEMDEVAWLPGGREFVWVSEKDGWRHAYAVKRDGSGERLLTRFDGDLASIAAVDTRGGQLYFIASPANATQRYLYAAPLSGDGTVRRITPADQAGSHRYDISPDGRWAIHTWSTFQSPPKTEIVTLPEHRSIRMLVDNASLGTKAAPIIDPPVEFLKVTVDDGVVLDGYMLKPKAFDAGRKYPVVVFVYGEPAGVTVNDAWGGPNMFFLRAIASQGYVVLSFDNRGTPALKGAAWRKVVYGAVGELSSKEQAAAVRALTAQRSYLDPERVGIWGWSGGGSNTLNAMFRYPDVYKVGVSVAPVPDQRLYDTIYQERYMGLPAGNEKGYRAGSPIHFADGLRGKLLVIHGSGDDNVHYQGTERLANRLIELKKPFDMMVYPGRSHSISEGRGTSLHVYSLIARYIVEHLPAGAR